MMLTNIQSDNMYESQHQKLAAMGIASLIATGHPKVLERLATEISNLWLDVFGEIKKLSMHPVTIPCGFNLSNLFVANNLISCVAARFLHTLQ